MPTSSKPSRIAFAASSVTRALVAMVDVNSAPLAVRSASNRRHSNS